MQVEILTRQDLEIFRKELLSDITEIIKGKTTEEKEYLRSKEVRKILGGISSGTLANLRVKGLLKPTKIEGVYYYNVKDVKAMLDAGRK
jgi:hypothetical protein